MKFLVAFSLFLVCGFSAVSAATGPDARPFPRPTEQCADRSLTAPVIQGSNAQRKTIALFSVGKYIDWVSVTHITDPWVYLGETFLAWDTPQGNLTTPLYRLYNPTNTDTLCATSRDTNAPSFPGYRVQYILGHVYPTQICGSVPLLGVYNAATGVHYYTTNAAVHTQFMGITGWVDASPGAFVIPVW
ncbi:hypothetical protein CVT26_015588 [Gymnopilus dilepis]|uniref:DUF5648 domain-containing protein n=1 Tax=Gymnopilus dilepis TaxID=231916 RepID=A0A409XYQ4_9AGAR|nr:hypothetical protein CVT26_015588 [Gymnopilus dilepis]